MALSPSHAAEAADVTPSIDQQELHITLRPRGIDGWSFQGTRAQLEAEGVTPEGVDWPEGSKPRQWRDRRFAWSLQRVRVVGQSLADLWLIRCSLLNGPDLATQMLRQRNKDIAKAKFLQSVEGRLQWGEMTLRLRASAEDKAFQAFKEKIPGLAKVRRQRS